MLGGASTHYGNICIDIYKRFEYILATRYFFFNFLASHFEIGLPIPFSVRNNCRATILSLPQLIYDASAGRRFSPNGRKILTTSSHFHTLSPLQPQRITILLSEQPNKISVDIEIRLSASGWPLCHAEAGNSPIVHSKPTGFGFSRNRAKNRRSSFSTFR